MSATKVRTPRASVEFLSESGPLPANDNEPRHRELEAAGEPDMNHLSPLQRAVVRTMVAFLRVNVDQRLFTATWETILLALVGTVGGYESLREGAPSAGALRCPNIDEALKVMAHWKVPAPSLETVAVMQDIAGHFAPRTLDAMTWESLMRKHRRAGAVEACPITQRSPQSDDCTSAPVLVHIEEARDA